MRTLLASLILLAALAVQAADKITAIVTITNAPSDGDVISINGDLRTWRTNVTLFGSEIAISTNTIPYQATNLFEHVTSYGFSPWVSSRMTETNIVELIGQVGQSMTVTNSAGWGIIEYSTNTITSAYTVRVPAEVEATAKSYEIADLLVAYIDDYATTNAFSATNLAMTNFFALASDETVTGDITFSGDVTFSGAQVGGSLSNYVFKFIPNLNTNGYGRLDFYDSTPSQGVRLFADTNGYPMMIDGATGSSLNYTPATDHILTYGIADNVFPALTLNNTFSGTNIFDRITNSVWVGGTITGATISGTIGTLTGGTIDGTVISNAVYYDTTAEVPGIGTSTGIVARLGTTNYIGRTLESSGNTITITNGDGVSDDPNLEVNVGNLDRGSMYGPSLGEVSLTEANFALDAPNYVYTVQDNDFMSVTIDGGNSNTNVMDCSSVSTGAFIGLYVNSIGGGVLKISLPDSSEITLTNNAQRLWIATGASTQLQLGAE